MLSPKGRENIPSSTCSSFSSSASLPPSSDNSLQKNLLCTKTFQCYNTQPFRTLHIQVNKLLEIIKNKISRKKKIDCNEQAMNIKNYLEQSDDTEIDSEEVDEEEEDAVHEEEGGKRRKRGANEFDKDYISNSNEKKSEKKHEGNDKNLMGRIFQLSAARLEEQIGMEMKMELNNDIKKISYRIVRLFHEYFTLIFYQALPASILYYPSQQVVGCDLHILQSHLSLTRERNRNKSMEIDRISIDSEEYKEERKRETGEGEYIKKNEIDNENENVHVTDGRNISDSSVPYVSTASSSADGVQTIINGTDGVGTGTGVGTGVNLRSFSKDSNIDGEKNLTDRGKMQVPFSSSSDDYKGSNDKDKDKDKNKDRDTIRLQGGNDKSKGKEREKEREGEEKKGKNNDNNQRDDCNNSSLLQCGYTPFAAAQSIEEAFSHLVVESSVFIDLLKRHGTVLQHFRF